MLASGQSLKYYEQDLYYRLKKATKQINLCSTVFRPDKILAFVYSSVWGPSNVKQTKQFLIKICSLCIFGKSVLLPSTKAVGTNSTKVGQNL